MRGNTLYIVVPCFNEEEVLPETARRLGEKLDALTGAGRIWSRRMSRWASASASTTPRRLSTFPGGFTHALDGGALFW